MGRAVIACLNCSLARLSQQFELHWSIATTGKLRARFSAPRGAAGMKVEKIKEEISEQVGLAPGIKLESPIKKELCQPGEDSVQPVKRRRLRRHDMHVGQNVAAACGKIETKEEGGDLHNFWLQVKQEVKEKAQSMDEESLMEGCFTKDAGVCKIEAGMAVKEEHAERSHQAGHEWQPKLRLHERDRECLFATLFTVNRVVGHQTASKKLRIIENMQSRLPNFGTYAVCHALMSTFADASMLSLHQVGSEVVAPITVKAEPQAGGSVSKLEKVKMEPARLPEASTAGVVKVEPGSSAEARPQRTDPADGKPAPPEFEEQVALWARQCAEFRKRATWMPTRPGISRRSSV